MASVIFEIKCQLSQYNVLKSTVKESFCLKYSITLLYSRPDICHHVTLTIQILLDNMSGE